MSTNSSKLEAALGYQFKNPALLTQALTHKSYAYEKSINPEPKDYNERLEFLGDAVLSLAVAELLMMSPKFKEGELTKRRALLVNERSLARQARKIELSFFIMSGKGEGRSGGAEKESILASTLEAIFGAIFLDSGYESAAHVISQIFKNEENEVEIQNDYKSMLQEKLQAQKKVTPKYVLDSTEGPPHQREFFVSVFLQDKKLASGRGKNRKEAEQKAAQIALELEIE